MQNRLRSGLVLLLGLIAGLGSGLARADDWSAAQLSCPVHQPIAQLFEQRGALPDKPVLLYLWSPRMVLSVQHAHEVQQVAHSLGLQWLPVLDPRLPLLEAQNALAAVSPQQAAALLPLRTLCDKDLLLAGQTLRHFPTAWVFTPAPEQGGLLLQGLPIVSAMPPQFWRQAMQERLAVQAKKRQAGATDLPAALKSRAIH